MFDSAACQVSLRAVLMAGCFTPLLHAAKEGKDSVYVPQAPSNGSWFVTELAKLELNPGASKNICTQSETPECIWRPQYNQFARLIVVSVGTTASGYQKTHLTGNGGWLFPGFKWLEQNQGCLQSCGGPGMLPACRKYLNKLGTYSTESLSS